MSNTVAGHVRRTTVVADDGVPIAVCEYGPADAAVTAVFLHGHCMRSESWDLLRDQLEAAWNTRVRMVFYDHRGHGDSGRAPASSYTIDQLGRDLATVVAAVVPVGPVVVVGHSMGGMAALAWVRQQPELVRTRLAGIALIATAANGLADAGLGRLLRSPAVSVFHTAARWAPRATAGSKRVGCAVGAAAVRVAGTRGRSVDPRVVAITAAMAGQTSIVTVSSFLKSFVDFDESATVSALAGIPAVVVCGTADVLTPLAHSEALAARLPGAELVRIRGAGHSVILERAPEVAAAIDGLVARVRSGGVLAPAV
ncbi:alpha/beta fold hydrolase [Rhodococcus sp. NPDC003318]|uniref:alpha/beta fold hydrolase n=1 Tax=Rhodococcus sp. NPDC003318 TaxID=3364503 RepID=UPI003689D17E